MRGARTRRLAAGAALGAALLVAGCGNSNPARDVLDEAGVGSAAAVGAALGRLFGAEPAETVRPTREQLEGLNAALIWARYEGLPDGAPFIALAENRGVVSYLSVDRRTIALTGAQIVSTQGLLDDLRGYRSDPAEDPAVAIRPAASWPPEVRRVYRHADGLSREFARAAVCRPQVWGVETVTVYDRQMRLTRIDEPCATPSRRFVNRYWVDAATGYVWRSDQWVSPGLGVVTYEVIRPFVRSPQGAAQTKARP